jgi:DNA polymerase elongation subunit (family B)
MVSCFLKLVVLVPSIKLKTNLLVCFKMEFQVLNWWDMDVEADNCESDDSDSEPNAKAKKELVYSMYCFGRTDIGKSIECCITGFTPFFYIKLPENASARRIIKFVEDHYCLNKLSTPLVVKECGVVERKDIFNFNNNQLFKFLRLVFTSKTAMKKAKYIFKPAVDIPGVVKNYKFKLYESNFEPFMRFTHIQDIKTAGWCSIENFKTNKDSRCDISVKVNKSEIKPIKEPKIPLANFLQVSWDIETYSVFGNVAVDKKAKVRIKKNNGEYYYPNEIFQIGVTCQWAQETEPCSKYIFTLKKCGPIEGAIVKEYPSERELIKDFVKTIANLDPDILYTYNGDGFDCKYLIERSEILGIDKWVLRQLSRLKDVPAEVKEEKFSSSAWGDNEYTRFYIPGRLGYDLCIHYKRGMKKYDSYKLDNIANNVLKDNKLPMDYREMFEMYRKGDPKDINLIARYCIKDTYLLQRLVDKQLILMSIIQLANVTYVPVNYLLTKGQTIKTYSQMLKKARELKFLVPDTNFNENNFPLIMHIESHNLYNSMGVYTTVPCGDQIVLEEPPMYHPTKIECKLSEVIDENRILVNGDFDILEPMYNMRCKIGNRQVTVKSILPAETECETGFTGASVLEPLFGVIMDDVVTLDFASLYPTIIMGFNLDYSTFVQDPKYDNLEGVDYLTLEWDDNVEVKLRSMCDGVGKTGLSRGKVCGKQAYYEVSNEFFCRIHDPEKKTRTEKHTTKPVHYKYRIVQKKWDTEKNEWENKGVLPSMLEDLYSARKLAKKEMAKAKGVGDYNRANNFDSLQMATKLALNSAYGYLGRTAGNLIKKELAQLVTYCGRTMINQSKEYMEDEFLELIKRDSLLTHTIPLN